MKEKVFEGFKELEKHAGEDSALANAKFVIALLDDTNERWEIQFKALQRTMNTIQTSIFILLGIIPIVLAILIFFKK